MNFLNATYSGVTWWQLFGGWFLFGFMLPIVVFRRAKTVIKTVEVEKPLSGRDTDNLVRPYVHECLELELKFAAEQARHNIDLQTLSSTIEKVRSLEAQIERLISRPRQANGRFTKAGQQ